MKFHIDIKPARILCRRRFTLEINYHNNCIFSIQYMYHRIKGETLGRLVFFRRMILLIKHIADWKLIRHKKQKNPTTTPIKKLNHNQP